MNMTTEPNEPINNAGKAANGQPYNRIDMGYIETTEMLTGLTKREHFAAMAMQGYVGSEFTGQSGMPFSNLAEWSVQMADALIEALNKAT